MQAVLAAVIQILSLVLQVLPILQQIRDTVSHTAVEDGPKVIQSFVSDNYRALTHATYGLNALHTDIAAVDTKIDTVLTNVEGVYTATQVIIDDIAAIGAPPDYSATLQAILDAIAGIPTPPTPPSTAAIAEDVWQYPMVDSNTPQGLLQGAGLASFILSAQVGLPLAGAPMFSLWGPWDNYHGVYANVQTPLPDWSDIGADETILAWLQRTDAQNTWEADINTGLPVAVVSGGGAWGHFEIRPSFFELPARAGQPPPPSLPPIDILTAPVWPGVADATLGGTVSLVDQLELAGPMHGVITNITTPPSKTGLRMIGGQPYDYNVGEIAFVSDRGDIEPWQYMGFRTALFTPKTMATASAALFRVLAGAVGTARTFTINE